MAAIEPTLIEKLRKLPLQRLAEVMDFVEFLAAREERAAACANASSRVSDELETGQISQRRPCMRVDLFAARYIAKIGNSISRIAAQVVTIYEQNSKNLDRIARHHGGSFDLLPRQGCGLIARVSLPAQESAASPDK
jgi:hypothetical protein